tara:strand:- start:223 stop:405 length:183 start_codon:yes stop_codon:yes gene_type:complete
MYKKIDIEKLEVKSDQKDNGVKFVTANMRLNKLNSNNSLVETVETLGFIPSAEKNENINT